MARYAMIDTASGIVVNVIEWDGDEANWKSPTGYTMVLDDPPAAGPGFTYADGVFTPPPGGEVPGAAVEETSQQPPAAAPKRRK